MSRYISLNENIDALISIVDSAISTTVTIVLSSEDEIVTTRSTVLLVCVAHGNPAPSISWLFDGSSSIDNGTSLKASAPHTHARWPYIGADQCKSSRAGGIT